MDHPLDDFTDADLEATLRGFHDRCHAQGARSEAFWSAQRGAIRAKLAERRSRDRAARRWTAMAAAAAILVCVIVAAVRDGEVRGPVASTEADQELLLSIERSLDREIPRALEPVSLITAELDRAASKSAAPEKSNLRTKRGS